jgi:hypothetical protein
MLALEMNNKVLAWVGGGFGLVLLVIFAFVAGVPANDVEGARVASVCKPALERIFADHLPSVEDNDHHPILMIPYSRLDRLDVSGDFAFCSLGARAVERPLPDTGNWYWRAGSFAKLRKKGEQWQITASHLCLPGDAADEVCDQEQIKTVICEVNVDCPGVTSE